jgi:hypothetical protein
MLVYEGTISPAEAENTWENFGHPPLVIVTRIKTK